MKLRQRDRDLLISLIETEADEALRGWRSGRLDAADVGGRMAQRMRPRPATCFETGGAAMAPTLRRLARLGLVARFDHPRGPAYGSPRWVLTERGRAALGGAALEAWRGVMTDPAAVDRCYYRAVRETHRAHVPRRPLPEPTGPAEGEDPEFYWAYRRALERLHAEGSPLLAQATASAAHFDYPPATRRIRKFAVRLSVGP